MSETGEVLALNEIIRQLTVKALEQNTVLTEIERLTRQEDGLTYVSKRLHEVNLMARKALKQDQE